MKMGRSNERSLVDDNPTAARLLVPVSCLATLATLSTAVTSWGCNLQYNNHDGSNDAESFSNTSFYEGENMTRRRRLDEQEQQQQQQQEYYPHYHQQSAFGEGIARSRIIRSYEPIATIPPVPASLLQSPSWSLSSISEWVLSTLGKLLLRDAEGETATCFAVQSGFKIRLQYNNNLPLEEPLELNWERILSLLACIIAIPVLATILYHSLGSLYRYCCGSCCCFCCCCGGDDDDDRATARHRPRSRVGVYYFRMLALQMIVLCILVSAYLVTFELFVAPFCGTLDADNPSRTSLDCSFPNGPSLWATTASVSWLVGATLALSYVIFPQAQQQQQRAASSASRRYPYGPVRNKRKTSNFVTVIDDVDFSSDSLTLTPMAIQFSTEPVSPEHWMMFHHHQAPPSNNYHIFKSCEEEPCIYIAPRVV